MAGLRLAIAACTAVVWVRAQNLPTFSSVSTPQDTSARTNSFTLFSDANNGVAKFIGGRDGDGQTLASTVTVDTLNRATPSVNVATGSSPFTPLSGATAVYVGLNQGASGTDYRTFILGGRNTTTNTLTMNVATWDGSSQTWVPSETVVASPGGTLPAARTGSAAAYVPKCNMTDPANPKPCIVMFGGAGTSGLLNDVWALWLTENPPRWQQVMPNAPTPVGNQPTGRQGAMASVSTDGTTMYVYGGTTATGPVSDMFALAPAGFPDATTDEMSNIALYTQTAESSTLLPWGAGGSRTAVDGNLRVIFEPAPYQCSHTSDELRPWWRTRLNSTVNIDAVKIYPRSDGFGWRNRAMQIFTSPTNTGDGAPPPNGDRATMVTDPIPNVANAPVTVMFSTPRTTQYVWVVLPDLGWTRVLTLCEVQIFVKKPWVWRRLSGISNVAVGRPARQTTLLTDWGGGDPNRAVDGEVANNYDATKTCAHTAGVPAGTEQFWQVDLGGVYDVRQIKVWPRTDCCTNRNNNFIIYAGYSRNNYAYDQRCFGPFDFNSNLVNAIAPETGVYVNVPCTTKARYLTVAKNPQHTGGDDSTIALCEVQVWAEKMLNNPAARRDFSSVSFRGNMVIYGGTDANGFRMDDIRFFNLNTRTWAPAFEPLGTGIAGRAFGGLAILSDSHLLFHGGSTNSDVSSDMAILTFPTCPSVNLYAAGVASFQCTAAGTVCTFVCQSGFTDNNRGKPVVCREDGQIDGIVPPCTSTLASSPPAGTYQVTVLPSNTSVYVQWQHPGFTGYGNPAIQSYSVRATPREFFEDFGAGKFIDETKWRVYTPDVPSASFFFFKDGALHLDAGSGTDTWMNYIVDDVIGNYYNNWATRNMFILYRDWPSEVDPAQEWTIEAELEAYGMPGNSLASIGILDLGVTAGGAGARGEVQLFLGVRYTDGGDGGATATIVYESMGGRVSRLIPALSRHVYLRLEYTWTQEQDREGNWVLRASYKYDAGSRWTRIYAVINRRHIMGQGLNTTTNRLQGVGWKPQNLRPYIGVKSWNGNEYARAQTSFRFLKIRQGLVQARQGPTVIVPYASYPSGTMNVTLNGLTKGASYDVTVQAVTVDGIGAAVSATRAMPDSPAVTSIDWGVREVAVNKPAFVRPGGSDTYWGGPPSLNNDGNWLGNNPGGNPANTGFWHGSCNQQDYWGVDLGVEYAAVKSIRIRNRCDADWAAFRGRHWSFMIGDDVRGPYTTNQHAPMVGYDKYFYLAAQTPAWIFGDWGLFNWPPTTIWQATYNAAQDRLIQYLYSANAFGTDPTFCQARIPTAGEGRYFYVANNVGDCMHFHEINVFTSNSCPQRDGLLSVEDASGGQSCAGGTAFGVSCTQSCVSPNFLQSGTRKTTCNGERWTGGFAARVVCAPVCSEIEPPPYVDILQHEIINENFANMGSNNYRTERLSTLNPVFSPLANVWSFDDGTAQAIGRLGLPEEPSLVFVVDKIRAMDQFTPFQMYATFTTADRAGLLYRIVDAKNFYRAVVDVPAARARVEAVVDGVPKLISDAPIDILANAVTTLGISSAGYAVNVTVNGRLTIITQDRQFSQGYAGIYAQSTARFTSFRFLKTARTCAGAQQGERCLVTCQPGLTSRSSPVSRTCRVDGTWDIDPVATPTVCTLNPPSFPSAIIAVKENSGRNTFVGTPLVAQSPSPVFPVQFSMNRIFSGASKALMPDTFPIFSVDFCTGQVKVRQNNVLDYEFVSQYTLEVRAYVLGFSDAFQDRNITVNIVNVDEPPVIIGGQTLYYAENLTTGASVGLVQWWDPENNTVAWTEEIRDARFSVNSTGGINVIALPATDLGFPSMGTGATSPLSFEGGRGLGEIYLSIKQTNGDTSLGATSSVNLAPLDMNDPPIFSPASPVFTVAELGLSPPLVVGTPNVYDEDVAMYNNTAILYAQVSPSVCNVSALNMPTTWTPLAPSSDWNTAANRLFDVNPTTGQVTMVRAPGTAYGAVDGNADPIWKPFLFGGNGYVRAVYSVCVAATDDFGATTSRPVQVAISAYLPSTPLIKGIGIIGSNTSVYPTTGGNAINITGSGFLSSSITSLVVTYGNQPLGVNNYTALCSGSGLGVVADNSIVCRTVPGIGGQMQWYVRLNNRNVLAEVSPIASYDVPVVRSMTGHTNMSFGGQTVTITGTNFGPNSTAPANWPVISYGPSSNPTKYSCAILTYSHTVITCKSSNMGGGRDMAWSMRIGGQAAIDLTSSTWSYGYPVITSIKADCATSGQSWYTCTATTSYTPQTLSTTGGQAIILIGSYLGYLGYQTLEVRYGGVNGRLLALSNCQRDATYPSNAVRCLTVPGVGTGLRVWLAVEGVPLDTGTYLASGVGLAYARPVVTRMYGPGYTRADTGGGQRIVVEGSGFGPVALMGGTDSPITGMTYGPSAGNLRYTASACRMLIDDRQLECYSDEGVGGNLVYRLVIGGQIINNTNGAFGAGSYAPPSLAGFDGDGAHVAVTRGGQDVVITGRNFGPMDAYTNGLLAVSYGQDLLTDIKNSTNGRVITGNVTFTAVACAITVAHSQITCKTTQGAGGVLVWDVVVASQHSSTPTTDYAVPFITSITYKTNGQPVNDADVDGGQWVVVSGQFMGPTQYATSGRSLVQAVSYGEMGSEYVVPQSDWRLISHETLEAKLQPGSGVGLMFRVEVADQVSESDLAARFSYALPEVVTLDPATATTYSDPKSPIIVTVAAKNVPLRDPKSKIVLKFGAYNPRTITAAIPKGDQAIAAVHNADGTYNITFPLPKTGGGLGIPVVLQVSPAGTDNDRVDQQSQKDARSAFNYLNPVVSDIIVTKARFSSSSNITGVGGSDYGACPFYGAEWSCSDLSDVYEMVLVGKHLTSGQPDWNDGVTRNLELMLANNTDSFVGHLGPVWSDERGQTSRLLWVGSWEHERVVAYYKRVQRAGQPVVGGTIRLTIGSVAYYGPVNQTVIREFKEQSPEVNGVVGNGAPFPTSGAPLDQPITLKLTNLLSTADLNVTVGGVRANVLKQTGPGAYAVLASPSEIAQWVTQNDPTVTGKDSWELLVQVPPGQGKDQRLQVTKVFASGEMSRSNDGFSVDYLPPVVNRVQVVRRGVPGSIDIVTGNTKVVVPTDGQGGVVRLYGSNLGTAPIVLIGDGWTVPASAIVPCTTAPAPAAHTCYEFTAPAGEGDGYQHVLNGVYEYLNGYRVVLNAGGQESGSVGFKYEAPAVTRVTSATGLFPTRGGVTVQLTGDNFGVQKLGRPVSSIQVKFGRPTDAWGIWTNCSSVVRLSHTVMNCTLPEGSGKSLAVWVNVAGLANVDANNRPVNLDVFSYNKPVITGVTVSTRVGGGGGLGNWVTLNSTVEAGFDNPVAHGKTDGGDAITLVGSNFGRKLDGVHCAFFAWAYRSTDPSRVPTCNDYEDYLGEGEVSASNVISWDHERIVLRTPPGIGVKDIELSIRGSTLEIPQQDSRLWRFIYSAPVLGNFYAGSLRWPAGDVVTKFDTEGGESMTVFGANLGPAPIANSSFRSDVFAPTAVSLSAAPSLPTATVVLVFHRACISDSRDLFGARPALTVPISTATGSLNLQLDKCSGAVDGHDHGRLAIETGPGIGKNRTAYVIVLDGPYRLESNKVYLDYLSPEITDVNPILVKMEGIVGQNVDIKGNYFGNAEKAAEQGWTDDEKELKVAIGGYDKACVGPGLDRFNQPAPDRRRQLTPATATQPSKSVTIVMCSLDQTLVPAGIRNVSLTVAGQNGRLEALGPESSLVLACAPGYFGRVNETCLPCPAQDEDPAKTGADCPGFNDKDGWNQPPKPNVVYPTFEQRFRYPVPRKGWYNLNSSDAYTAKVDGNPSMLDACPEGHRGVEQDPSRDLCIVPCDPPESCLGNNICAEGYTSKQPMWRCSSCDKGYYRRSGECIKCPDSPAALFVGFILLVIVVAGVGFALNRKQINIAVLSIGVDFFQVLAIFAQARVKWPPVVKELLHVLSAFNLNIEIVAPECLIPDVSYKQKFWFIMILPLCIAGLFGLNYVALLFFKAVIQGQPKKMWHTHKPALVSSCLVLLYLLYLYLTRTIFDVFNCAPTYPPDGKQYLQVVFEECGIPGGTQMTLMGYAIAGLIVYTAGYPLFIGWVLFKNREVVMEDQLLRAKGTGNDKLTNPRAYDLRITYGRSYFQFKPDWCLWILAIILRKFFIAITAVVFGKNSSFQMAACLLIMFLAYAAQVQLRPYMSPGDFEEVLKGHTEASYVSATHARLRASLAGIESRGRKKGHKNLINFEGKIDRAAVFGVLTGFFFNYNTVEAIMTFCAVIVCLMAIMYQANELNSYYPQSKDSVTSVVLIIVIWAIVYFFTVLVTEIVVLYNEDNRGKQLAKQAKANRGKGDKAKTAAGDEADSRARQAAASVMEVNVGNVEATTNPMFLSQSGKSDVSTAMGGDVVSAIMSQRDAPPVELWRVFQSSFAEMDEANKALREQLAEAKRKEAAGAVEEEHRPSNRAGSKLQFAPKSSTEGANPMRAGGKMSLAATRKAVSTRAAVSSSADE